MPNVAIIISIMEGDGGSAGCLEECQRQVDAVAAEGKYSFFIILNDAGEEGYVASWEKATKAGADFFLWIDHDLILSEGAVACLLENSVFLRHKAVITGKVSRADKRLVFGGRTRRGRLLEPDPVIPIPCHLFDMAVALVPGYAFSSLENPVDFFRKSLLNYGYGNKTAKAGVARRVAPGVLGVTGRNAEIPAWKNPESTMREKTAWLLRSIFK